MQDVLYIEDVEQAAALLKPRRLDILKQLAEPRSCPDLAEMFQETPQKIYYHVKVLEGAGLVDKVSERRVRGLMEGFYQAKARAYWLAPGLGGRVGGRQGAEGQMGLGFLMNLAEQLLADVGHLAQSKRQNIPSLGLSAQIVLRDARERTAFAQELQGAFQALASKYGRQENDPEPAEHSQTFRLMLACYPPLSPTRS